VTAPAAAVFFTAFSPARRGFPGLSGPALVFWKPRRAIEKWLRAFGRPDGYLFLRAKRTFLLSNAAERYGNMGTAHWAFAFCGDFRQKFFRCRVSFLRQPQGAAGTWQR